MSGECSECRENSLECECKWGYHTTGFLFAMPSQEVMEIRSSKPIDDLEIGPDEEIDGVIFKIYWNNQPLPWTTKTKLQAMAIAFGCQWGARETANKLRIF